MTESLGAKAAELPMTAGVYLFKDRRGKVIYVGKAINLRARVRQYLAGSDERSMVPYLVSAAHDVDVVVVHTEKEALILENSLIKRHRPRYNAKLRDDSNFLHARIDPRGRWARFELVRQIRDDGARYFGPYASASKARQTLEFVQRAFPLRSCTDHVLGSRTRPCLLHQLHRCVAPCVRTEEELSAQYADLLEGATEFLGGKTHRAVARLEARMTKAAELEQFEDAARLRNLIGSIRGAVERQKVVDVKLGDRDVWGTHRVGSTGSVAVVPVREGMMGEPRFHVIPAWIGDEAEMLSSLVNAHYPEGTEIPAEILVPVLPPDADALTDVLSDRRGSRVTLAVPLRGDKVRLMGLAQENARVRFLQETSDDERHLRAMRDLADAVGLAEPPRRIECFDNSNTQGTNPVAAMSVFVDGKPARAEYRRYKVKTVVGSDDYATMREILYRRYKRVLEGGERADLLVVDGGKGQLGVALAVLKDLGVTDQAVIGLSKPRTELARGERDATDKIVLPNAKDPLRLPAGHPGLRILQHIRDEAHRHAVMYHRKVRGQANLTSLLEAIPGVGPARRRALLRAFGSAEGVADAGIDRLAAIPGIGPALATVVHEALNP
ncbi:MAG: excinuclease ABC subunit UvrC, partial [Deltaproteobacteria bacterium]|nr:excinuclease ABC subunit UvrC [Deltaproteobacteria bacterium]